MGDFILNADVHKLLWAIVSWIFFLCGFQWLIAVVSELSRNDTTAPLLVPGGDKLSPDIYPDTVPLCNIIDVRYNVIHLIIERLLLK